MTKTVKEINKDFVKWGSQYVDMDKDKTIEEIKKAIYSIEAVEIEGSSTIMDYTTAFDEIIKIIKQNYTPNTEVQKKIEKAVNKTVENWNKDNPKLKTLKKVKNET